MSQSKANPVKKKATEKKKKVAIDSDEEARQNVSIKLKLDSDIEELSDHEENGSDDEDTIYAEFSTLQSLHASIAFNPPISPVSRKSQGVKRAAAESLVFSQVYSPSRKILRAHPSENKACVQILQEVRLLGKIVRSQSSYIKELKKKVDNLTALVKKRRKTSGTGYQKDGNNG